MMHTCSRCQLKKDSSLFYVKNGKLNSWCKDCYRQDHRVKYTPSKGQTDDIRKCKQCTLEYAPKQRTESFFCSQDCKDKFRKQENKVNRIASKSERLCIGCNNKIPASARSDKKWCSEECALKVRGHTMNTQRRIRTSEAIQDFKRIDIYERDGWICQLCKKNVNPQLFFPNSACASLDHVIPLSRGGSHKATNVQLAHLRCNTSRGNKVENLSPRPSLILKQKVVFTLSEASTLIGVSKSVLLRGIETKKVPFIQDGKFGSRYLSEKIVEDLILTGIPGSLKWHRERPKNIGDKTRKSKCLNCGDIFIISQERKKYCSPICVRTSTNTRRRVEPQEIKCSVCAKVIKNHKSNKKVNLCSNDCVNIHRRTQNSSNAKVNFSFCKVCDLKYQVVRKPGRKKVTCSEKCAVILQRMRAAHSIQERRKSKKG